MKTNRIGTVALKHLVAVFLALLVIIPFAIVVLGSLKTNGEAAIMTFTLPKIPQWQNYGAVIKKAKLLQAFFNSFLYAVVPTMVVVVVTAMAAFVLSRRSTKRNWLLYLFLILGLFVPQNYLASIKVMQALHIYGSRLGVILFYIGSNIAFCVFIIFGFFDSLPRELDEAAVIDGASPLVMFFRVIFPLLKPVLATSFILIFMGIWSDFMTPLYLLSSSTMWPMNLAVYNFFGREAMPKWNLIFADIVLTCLPVLVVYIVGQRQIIGGLTSGSVKG